MRARFWQTKLSDTEVDGIESRFPPGSRSGEGSQSLHIFLESARRTRLPVGSPPHVHERRREHKRGE